LRHRRNSNDPTEFLTNRGGQRRRAFEHCRLRE
jgi:hypothetical protein